MFLKKTEKNIIFYTSPLFERLGVAHMFCTRFGGVSSGDFDSLNVSTARKDRFGFADSAEKVSENYRRGLSALGASVQTACAAKQVHSDVVSEADDSCAGLGVCADNGEMKPCDAVIVRKLLKNVSTACVKTADCVPILLADTSTGDVCAVHAGWRGTAGDIASKAAQKLSHGKPENIAAAIGPCIGRCCYEIGDEVYLRFKTLFLSKCTGYDMNTVCSVFPSCSMGGSFHLDLARANAELLEMCGVRPENIDVSGICTCCFSENGVHPFFSHRASGGHSGTFLSAVSVF